MPRCRVALLALASVLTALAAAGASAAPGEDVLHEVRGGDNLHLIAGYYYGDARQWERIWRANRDQVPNPNRLEQGAWLRVPDAAAPAEAYADFLQRMATRRPAPGAVEEPAPVVPASRLTPVSAASPGEPAAVPAGGRTPASRRP